MSPDTLFQIANPLALVGWVALAAHPAAPRVTLAMAQVMIPLLLALAYTGLILTHWSDAEGGFSSLTEVMKLLSSPPIALAGWVHYLAFDLFVGAWAAQTARREGISHLLVLPCLALIFLFGPAGFLAFSILRFAITRKVPT